jgi:hypothetical protein
MTVHNDMIPPNSLRKLDALIESPILSENRLSPKAGTRLTNTGTMK